MQTELHGVNMRKEGDEGHGGNRENRLIMEQRGERGGWRVGHARVHSLVRNSCLSL